MQETADVDPLKVRVAYGSIPKEGGTFTFYKNHRRVFAEAGVELFCVTIGREASSLWNELYADDGCHKVAERTTSLRRQVIEFIRWCDEKRVSAVIPVNSRPILAALPHLPSRIRVIARCANALHDEYLYTTTGLERVTAVVALTPRLSHDLVNHYGVPEELIHLVPNGVDVSRFQKTQGAASKRPLRLGFLGRLEHKQKGVLFLPDVVRELDAQGVDFQLRIGGAGIHENELRAQLAPWIRTGEVALEGLLSREKVPSFLSQCDVYVFPSQFEGCPNALLEAMSAGCVPVAWVIEGITDFIVDHGKTGFLLPLGDTVGMADAIVKLAQDPELLARMTSGIREAAINRFSLEECASRYTALISEAMEQEPLASNAAPIRKFDPPAYLKRRLPWLPAPLRENLARRWRAMKRRRSADAT